MCGRPPLICGRNAACHGLYTYMAVTNGMAMGYAPPAHCLLPHGAGLHHRHVFLFLCGGVHRAYHRRSCPLPLSLPERKRFGFLFGVYQTYELMDACLLWLPYPLMLVNRALCGFLGIQSATIRQAAVQRYIPDRLRARLNAYESLLCTAAGAVLSLAIGALGGGPGLPALHDHLRSDLHARVLADGVPAAASGAAGAGRPPPCGSKR